MIRRDLLGALGGAFALSSAGAFSLDAIQGGTSTRTINDSAAERLKQAYSYVPNTPEYEALAIYDGGWSDIGKQFDAFGYIDRRSEYDARGGKGYLAFLSTGPDSTFGLTKPGIFVHVPVLTADQILVLSEGTFPKKMILFTGIDVSIPAGIFKDKGFDSTTFRGGAIYVHSDQAPEENVSWNRFAVLLDVGILAWFDTESSARKYVDWYVEGGTSLTDRVEVVRRLALMEQDAITCVWRDGAHLNLSGAARKVLGNSAQESTVAKYRELMEPTFQEEEKLFGIMPQILSIMVSCDAGASPEPESLAPGFQKPLASVKLQFSSTSDVELAAEIIEWRMINAPSLVTRKTYDFGLLQPIPIDPAENEDGILIQRFEDPYPAAHRVAGMLQSYDIAIYGWGEFS